MARYRLHRKLGDGSYETVHYETSAKIVVTESGDNVENALAALHNLVSQAQSAAASAQRSAQSAASAANVAQSTIVSHQSNMSNPHATNYQQVGAVWHAGRISADIINNPKYEWPYMASYGPGEDIGLPAGWWHILYFHHMDINGYGSQLAIGLTQTLRVYVRTSSGADWSEWAPIPTLTASTVDIGAGAPLTTNRLYLVYE